MNLNLMSLSVQVYGLKNRRLEDDNSGMRKLKLLPLYIGSILLILFARPTLSGTIVGISMIAVGEILRVWATGHLLKNKSLTVTGPYAYVKNPLYVGTILISAGLCVLANNIYLLATLMLLFCFYYIPYKKNVESSRLQKIFGAEYEDYDRNVPDYYPRLTPYSAKKGSWRFRNVVDNSEALLPLLLAGVVAIILTRPHWMAALKL